MFRVAKFRQLQSWPGG